MGNVLVAVALQSKGVLMRHVDIHLQYVKLVDLLHVIYLANEKY